jgi:predicted RNA-binding protein
MCEASAYLIKDGREQLIMESVDIIEPEGPDTYLLVGIFGEQKTVKGRIKGMNLVNHKILFEEISVS